MRAKVLLIVGAALLATACDKAAPRQPRVAPPPPGVLDAPPPAPPAPVAETGKAKAPPSPITWDAAKGAFVFKGQPLRAEKLWGFDGATDGFVATGGEVQPGEGAGMTYRASAEDPILRSPKGLNVDGHGRTLVIVRLTRIHPGGRWDGTLFYSTRAHGESAEFQAKPLFGGDPAVGATEVMVFDMSRLKRGGADWTSSIIDQIRLDLDNTAGGEFVIRQIAIAQDPGGLAPPPAAEAPAKAP